VAPFCCFPPKSHLEHLELLERKMPAERRPRAVHLLLLLGVGAVRALVRPGECVINGECQRDPERLHGLQDWAGYASHGSGHLPARYSANRPPGRAAWGVSPAH